MITGNTMLSIGETLVVQNSGTVFGMAECECHSRDIQMRVILTSPAAQDGQSFGASLWVGQDNCSDQTQHTTNGALCERITTMEPPDNGNFQLDPNSFRSVSPVNISLPGEALIKQKPVGTTTPFTYTCDSGGPQNVTAQVLLGPDSAPATCKLPLTVNTQGPTAPQLDSVGSGNGALTVRWSVPASSSGIQYYQVLCRSKTNPTQPVMSQDFLNNTRYYFSACLDGVLYRRPLDAGFSNTTEKRPGLGTPASGDFLVDPRFICSDRITATTTDLTQRISGLNNGEDYEVMVVSIDYYGNASKSDISIGTPQPTKALLDDLCSTEDQCPAGFGCNVLGRMPGPSTLLPVAAFGLLLGLARRRRSSR